MAADVAKVKSQVAWDKKGRLPRKKVALEVSCFFFFGLLLCELLSAKTHATVCRLGLTNPHFGHLGKARSHHGHPLGFRYARITAPNPKFVDGTWVSKEDEMEVTFFAFRRTGEGLKRHLRSMLRVWV